MEQHRHIIMENFEHSFSVKSSEKKAAQALWNYYLYIYAPRLAIMIIYGLSAIFLGAASFDHDFAAVMIPLGFAGLFCTLVEFPIYRSRVLKVTRPTGVFEKETFWHFYSDKFFSRCGENEQTSLYNTFTGYFRFRNSVFLLMGNQLFACGFAEHLFEDKLDGFLGCLEQAGVKKIKFFTIKRWLSGIMISVLCIAYCIFRYFIGTR